MANPVVKRLDLHLALVDSRVDKDASIFSEVKPSMILLHANSSEQTLYSGALGKYMTLAAVNPTIATTLKNSHALQDRMRQFM